MCFRDDSREHKGIWYRRSSAQRKLADHRISLAPPDGHGSSSYLSLHGGACGLLIVIAAMALLIVCPTPMAQEPRAVDAAAEGDDVGSSNSLMLGKPLMVPRATRPATEPIAQVFFGTSIVRPRTPPEVLFVDEMTSSGDVINEAVVILRDDGEEPDVEAGDNFYNGPPLELGSNEETERYFRYRAEYFGESVVSEIAVFPITWLPLGSRPSNPDTLVDSADGQDSVFTNEVIIKTFPGVSPRRVRSIVTEVGETLGLPSIGIAGYIPGNDSYLVEEFDGDRTLDNVDRMISVFLDYANEIEYASPNFQGRPTALQWFLEDIGIGKLRELVGGGPPPVTPPVYGSNEIGVAIADTAVNCNLLKKCANKPKWGTNPQPGPNCGSQYIVNKSHWHGTKVAALVAGDGTAPGGNIQGVEQGVAWGAKLYPFMVGSGFDLNDAITCAVSTEASAGKKIVHIINISREQNESKDLEKAVCLAASKNTLIVAASGNYACQGILKRYPASYNDTMTSCGAIGNHILKIGATANQPDDFKERSNKKCSSLNAKSQPGELYAPGWGLPNDNNDIKLYGTSFAAGLVSGCAAVVGAVDEWREKGWDAQRVEARLKDTSRPGGTQSSTGEKLQLLDCYNAIANPYDIVFVLDKSGSMGGSTHVMWQAKTRWDALKMGVAEFTNLIAASAPPGSRLGLTLFETKVVQQNTLPGLVKIDKTTLPGKVNNELNITPGGWTAMGEGLKDGMAKFDDPSRPRRVVLFTDGEQNQFPKVDTTGCYYKNKAGNTEGKVSDPCPATAGSVKIVAVGINDPDSSYVATLQALASNSGGNVIIASKSNKFPEACTGDVKSTFYCAVAPALYGNSLQMVTSYTGTLSNAGALPEFNLNKDVTQLLIAISLSQDFEIPEFLSILAGMRITKDGADITRFFEPVYSGDSISSVVLKTSFVYQAEEETSRIAPEGSYSVQIAAPPDIGTDLGYWVVPYADDHRLDMQWRVGPAAPRVNQPFSPTISLSWAGGPVNNAVVEARILKPGDDLGDLLANNPQTVDLVNMTDAGSPGHQKYHHLLENDPNFLDQLEPNEEKLILTHQGGGQYSASYDPGDVSGVYQIFYQVRAESAEFGKVQRKAVQSVYTRFGDIDLDKSAVSSTATDDTLTINFRPVTTYDRFIGPAQGSAFTVESDSIELSGITDHQDGSYTLVLTGDPDAEVVIKLLGEEIYQGPASGIEKNFFDRLIDALGSIGLPSWLVWFIAAVILLLLLWRARRLFGSRSGA